MTHYTSLYAWSLVQTARIWQFASQSLGRQLLALVGHWIWPPPNSCFASRLRTLFLSTLSRTTRPLRAKKQQSLPGTPYRTSAFTELLCPHHPVPHSTSASERSFLSLGIGIMVQLSNNYWWQRWQLVLRHPEGLCFEVYIPRFPRTGSMVARMVLISSVVPGCFWVFPRYAFVHLSTPRLARGNAHFFGKGVGSFDFLAIPPSRGECE